MAVIYSYPVKSTPELTDKMLISDGTDNLTKQVTISGVKDTIDVVDSLAATLPIEVSASSGAVTVSSRAYAGAATTGYVPTGGSNTTFLRGDGTWVTPAGGAANPAGNSTEVQYNSGGTSFGADELFTYANRTLSLGKVAATGSSHLKVYGGGSDDGKLTIYCSAGTHGVTIDGPDHTGGTPDSYTIKLPNSLPSVANQILESNASGTLSWIATPTGSGGISSITGTSPVSITSGSTPVVSMEAASTTVSGYLTTTDWNTFNNKGDGTPGGSSTQFQYNNGGTAFAGTDSLRFDADKIHMGRDTSPITRGQLVMYGDGTNASDIQLYNSGNNRFLKLAQQAGATQDLTLTFPGVASGGNNKILESDSTGQLSWIATPAAGSSAVTSYTNAVNNYILTSSGTGIINGESSLLYNGSILTLGTSKVFNASRSTTTSGVATAPVYVTNSATGSGAPTNFASNVNSYLGSKHIEFYHQGTSVGSITSTTGGIQINGETSDQRKKKNIVDWTENVLDKFALIEPKKFNFTHQDDSDPLIKGFMAQQMVDKFPEAYNHDYSISDTEGYYSFNAMGMNIYLMKAIKELKEEIDSLKSRVSTLEG